MTGAGSTYDVAFGDVSQSQIVIGDHATVQTADGVKIVYLVGDQNRPKPRLRALPVAVLPDEKPDLVGRDEQLEIAHAATAEAPLQLYGPDGIGKTALVKRLAHDRPRGRDGVVFLRARGRPLDDVLVALYHTLWESDLAYVPRQDELPSYLGERDPLVVLDDLDVDRDDLAGLLEAAPRATFVVASGQRTLWSRGRAQAVPPLGRAAGAALVERFVGRTLSDRERALAEGVAIAAEGVPQRLVEVAALVADGHATLEELVTDPGEIERRAAAVALSDGQRRVLAVLAAVRGATLVQVAGADAGELPELERRGWIRSASPRYRLVREPPSGADGSYTLVGLESWAGHVAPVAVADEALAIVATVDAGIEQDRLDAVLALVRATERKLALAGAVGSWERVLNGGLRAAQIGVRPFEEGLMLHQLGSRAACLGHLDEARALLLEALDVRVRAGDDTGAELTRHNLDQLNTPPTDGRTRRSRRGRWLRPWLLLVLLLAAAGTAVALAVAGKHDEPARRVRHHTVTRPATHKPAPHPPKPRTPSPGPTTSAPGPTVTTPPPCVETKTCLNGQPTPPTTPAPPIP
jgi:hypothetical protein